MRPELPSGTVTFLFTDVEGSTRLLEEIGDEAYEEALAVHRRIVRVACHAHDGVEVDTQGDAFFFAFPEPTGALAAAQQLTEGLGAGAIRVRVGLHTGTPRLGEEGYVGSDVHFGARIAASAHGGQVVLSQATGKLVDAYVLTDLGEHRLKDIEHAVPIFQLGKESFPPLKTISNTNLPRPASSFVGREHELGQVLTVIEKGGRLVTLTGPGGSGKTRLALEAASTLVPQYKAGVFWVGLAALRDPALVAETISQTLGAKDGLAEHVGQREMLLLLDNLEQVIEAAPELSSLLQSCPNLTLLVTSRELLRIQGEVEYAVPPLAESEAVALFCARSQLEPSQEVAELCARLDSLPLAVELAAARTKALSPNQILERLSQRLDLLKGGRDADPRQLTLRATIEWSYDLLTAEEQELFARLSVFAGGCTLEAAEVVADADLDILQSLVEKSLLRFSEGRYWMLETIREYAAERLDADGKTADTRAKHLDWVLDLARAHAPQLFRAADFASLNRVLGEDANISRAFSTAFAQSRADAFVELLALVTRAWAEAGRFAEVRAWALRASQMEDRDDAQRGEIQLALGFGMINGEPWQYWRLAHEAFVRAGALRSAAVAQTLMGKHVSTSVEEAATHIESAIGTFAAIGDRDGLRVARGNLAELLAEHATTDSERERAITLIRDAVREDQEAGDPFDVLAGRLTLAFLLLEQGCASDAREQLTECVAMTLELRASRFLPWLVSTAALYALRSGGPEQALVLVSARETLENSAVGSVSDSGMLGGFRIDERLAPALLEADLEEGTIARARASGLRMSADSVLEYLETQVLVT